jgi:DDE superfamily endonuclease
MRCEFLPPYSPDFNPIELTFLMMKYNLCRNGDYARLVMTSMSDMEIFTTPLRALYPITPEMLYGWYRYCGYV